MSLNDKRVTLERLQKNAGTTNEQLDLKCSDADLDTLATKVAHYYRYARALGLTDADIQSIDQDVRIAFNTKDKMRRAFEMWKSAYGDTASYRVLVKKAVEFGDGILGREICQLCARRTVETTDSPKHPANNDPSISPSSPSPAATNKEQPDPKQHEKKRQYFCTEDQPSYRDVQHPNMDTGTSVDVEDFDSAPGSVRVDKMWDLTRYRQLKIHFLNSHVLTDPTKPWGVTTDMILAWVTCTWNRAGCSYPTLLDIKATKDEAQIRVLFDASQRSRSKVGKDALHVTNTSEPTMVLNLYDMTTPQQKSLVLHEFGHALGLDHEHQRSDFWDVLGEKDEQGKCLFIIGEDKMKSGNNGYCQRACLEHFRGPWPVVKSVQTEYDPDSIMHYWFDVNWLLPDYRKLGLVKTTNELTNKQKRVLEGVHTRDYNNGDLAVQPSKLDFEVLERAYGKCNGTV